MSSGASPSFEGVSLDEVLAGGTGTPEAARLTPLAVLAFHGVEVVERREEPAGPGATADDLGRVMGFDHDPASCVFALSAFTTYLVFTASRVVLGLRPARTPPAGPPDPRS